MWWAISLAFAGDAIELGDPELEEPLLGSIGVRWPFAGDDDRDAQVTVRYRQSGGAWRDGLPLHRIQPVPTEGADAAPAELAGMVLDLRPGSAYELSLEVVDPDGGGTDGVRLFGSTRPEPVGPPAPNLIRVFTADGLRLALAFADPGDVIELQAGTYVGPFTLIEAATAEAPVVVRGVRTDQVLLTGDGCPSCAALTVLGSHVQVESLTLSSAETGLAFPSDGGEGNVARGLLATDVSRGIVGGTGQRGFTICDNLLLGDGSWPRVDDEGDGGAGAGAGVEVGGEGHTVCHNAVVGFAAGVVALPGSRAVEIVGNDLANTGAAVVLDGAAGNLRVAFNRITNTTDAVSLEPLIGGPALVTRNFALNVAGEQLRFHAFGSVAPSGMLVFHNTFVSPGRALTLIDDGVGRDFALAANLLVGSSDASFVVEWSAAVEGGSFDNDGWYPDGGFWWHPLGLWGSLAELQASGPFEARGVALDAPPLAAVADLRDPDDPQAPASATLSPASGAVDAAVPLPNLDDGYVGAGADLGAHELGCAEFPYGPRSAGTGWVVYGSCAPPGEGGPEDQDRDGDGLSDGVEDRLGIDPDDPDTDDDRLLDGVEGVVDSDGDGRLDALDPDDDDDGLLTRDEGSDDVDGDGAPNHLDLDSDGDGVADAAEGLPDALDAGGRLGAPPEAPVGCGCRSVPGGLPRGWAGWIAAAVWWAPRRPGGRGRGRDPDPPEV